MKFQYILCLLFPFLFCSCGSTSFQRDISLIGQKYESYMMKEQSEILFGIGNNLSKAYDGYFEGYHAIFVLDGEVISEIYYDDEDKITDEGYHVGSFFRDIKKSDISEIFENGYGGCTVYLKSGYKLYFSAIQYKDKGINSAVNLLILSPH